jgi:hypothetical protein
MPEATVAVQEETRIELVRRDAGSGVEVALLWCDKGDDCVVELYREGEAIGVVEVPENVLPSEVYWHPMAYTDIDPWR